MRLSQFLILGSLPLLAGTLSSTSSAPIGREIDLTDRAGVERLGQRGPSDKVCVFAHRSSCGPDGCTAVKPMTYALVDLESGRFSRCDQEACDVYPVQAKRSGIWNSITVEGAGAFAKVADDGTIVEVVTLNDVVLVSHGHCI